MALYKYFSRVSKDGNDSEKQPILPVPKEIKIVDEAIAKALESSKFTSGRGKYNLYSE